MKNLTALVPDGYAWMLNPKPAYDGWHAVIWRASESEPIRQWNGEGPTGWDALKQAAEGIYE